MPIAGIAGDQQAALFGQACFDAGQAKNTYGTGCFLLMNTGDDAAPSDGRPADDRRLEGRRRGHLRARGRRVHGRRGRAVAARRAAGDRQLRRHRAAGAATVPDAGGVYFVPAFVGLGAPHWDPYARGLIIGLTRDTTVGHIARATLEAMAYQSRDVLSLMEKDAGVKLAALRVDGGASANNALLQFQADLLGVPVRGRSSPRRPRSAPPISPGSRSATGGPRRRRQQLGARSRVHAAHGRGRRRA